MARRSLLEPEDRDAALKTRITGRSAIAAESRDPGPRSHRKASTWPAYSAPQNHPTTHHPKTAHRPKTTRPLAGRARPRRRRARRVRRTRKPKTKTTKRLNRSRPSLSNRKRLSLQRV